MQIEEKQKIIEALLFCAEKPLQISDICRILSADSKVLPPEVEQIVESLKTQMAQQDRPYFIDEVADGYMLKTHAKYAQYLKLLMKDRKKNEKPSPAAMEVLSIIAFKQPITRPQIEALRGVDCSSPLLQLVERGVIEATGKLEAPGRPTLYGTTTEFLKQFGLNSVNDLDNTIN